jgi:PAS domain S-box-containing protein
MMELRKYSLATVIAALLVTVTTLLLGGYFVFAYFAEAKEQRTRLEKLSNLQLGETSVALALPVWNIDGPQIEKVIEAMARPKSIHAIRVEAAGKTYGRIRGRDQNLVPWDGKVEPRGMMMYEGPITFGDRDLGKVRIYVSPRILLEDLRSLRLRLIGTVVVVDVLLVVCVYLLLQLAVLRPVRAIERYAVGVSHGGHPEHPVVPGAAAELSSLCLSIETMVRLLDTRYVELQEEMTRRSESEERFLSIFDSVNDGILLRDHATGAILDANQSACEMFGYTHEEMRQLPVGGLSSGEPNYTSEDARRTVSSANPGSAELFEWHARHHDGHLLWIEVNMRVATIGGEQRVLMVGRDITQRKAMEEKLRRSERMSAIGSLVAGVAHEVRNPLFGIAATLDAFEAEFGVTEETQEYLTTLRNDVSRLTRLMNDLLEFGRPHEIVRDVQSVEPVIAETARVCMAQAREKQVAIKLQVDQSLPQVSIDADRMLQVFKNVVENAIAFSKHSGMVVIGAEPDGDGMVVCTIADSGPGFRAEDLPHVFEPFFTRRRGGSGLGLAIVQKIVADHGGTVTAANAPAGGARIEIRIPTA